MNLTNLHLFPGICCLHHTYQPSFTGLTCLLVFPSRFLSSCPAVKLTGFPCVCGNFTNVSSSTTSSFTHTQVEAHRARRCFLCRTMLPRRATGPHWLVPAPVDAVTHRPPILNPFRWLMSLSLVFDSRFDNDRIFSRWKTTMTTISLARASTVDAITLRPPILLSTMSLSCTCL